MKKAMKLEEMIKKAKNEAPNLPAQELLEEFEEFARTFTAFQAAEEGAREGLIRKMADSHSRLMSHFMRVSASFGMTFEQFNEFIGNPENFEPHNWAEIEETKYHILASVADKKSNKLNKKARI